MYKTTTLHYTILEINNDMTNKFSISTLTTITTTT